jgi:hypothetical protein
MIFSFVLFSLVAATFAACPNEGVEWQSVCYYFQSNSTAFVNAEETCLQLGGHLASIHNGFTNAFIAQEASLFLSQSTTSDIWIGATDLMNPGNFTWTDGTDFVFSVWEKNKTNTGENCGSLDLIEGRWQTQDCFKQKPYVCAINQISNTTSTTTKRPTTIPSDYFCGYDWIYNAETQSCYGKMGKVSWNNAESYCQNYDAHLISIENDKEHIFVSTLQQILDKDLWLGLYSVNSGNDWKWTDHANYSFSAWAYDYPKLSSNLCGYLKGSTKTDDGRWYNDRWCSNDIGVICKKKISFK